MEFSASKNYYAVFQLQHCALRYDLSKKVLQFLEPREKIDNRHQSPLPKKQSHQTPNRPQLRSNKSHRFRRKLTNSMKLNKHAATQIQNISEATMKFLTVRILN